MKRSTAIEIVLNNQNNNIENGRDTQRVVLTKKQEIRLELARLGTKIDKMGLRTSTVIFFYFIDSLVFNHTYIMKNKLYFIYK